MDDDSDDGDFYDVEPSTAPLIIHPTSSNEVFSPCTISLNVLRQADSSDNWKLRARFDDDTKFTFKPVTTLTRTGVSLLNLASLKHRISLFRQRGWVASVNKREESISEP
jgi:hypothetical protein